MPRAARAALACLALVAASESPLWAWGNDGHKIVCAIAHKLLAQVDRDEVDRLTRLYRTPTQGRFQFFTAGCTFADTARTKAQDNAPGWERFRAFSNWHFLNLARTAATVDPAACNGDCVVHGIQHHAAQFANHGLQDQDRAEALLFLGHWVGDIHQPLHISYRDDRGGNLIRPISGGVYTSDHLHGVWDSGILGRAHPATVDWWTFAGQLRDAVTPALQSSWGSATPEQWSQESYAITLREKTLYCSTSGGECREIAGGRRLTSTYQEAFGEVVTERLQQAGVRLAALITRALHP